MDLSGDATACSVAVIAAGGAEGDFSAAFDRFERRQNPGTTRFT
jgi:hypothetical protein